MGVRLPPSALTKACYRNGMTLQGITFLELWKKHKGVIASMVRRKIVSSYTKDNYDRLMAAAQVALWEASNSYDETVGSRFWTFASHRISGALIDEMRSWDHMSRGCRARAKAGNGEPWELVHQRTITSVEGVLISKDNPESDAEAAEIQERLRPAMAILGPTERVVAKRILIDHEPVSKIARDLKVSQPRISQARRAVIVKLKKYFLGD